MVCISCFIAPVVLFVWYRFIYPILQPLINRLIGNYQLPQPFSNLSCPLPNKTVKCSTEAENNTDQLNGSQQTTSSEAASSGDAKKDN